MHKEKPNLNLDKNTFWSVQYADFECPILKWKNKCVYPTKSTQHCQSHLQFTPQRRRREREEEVMKERFKARTLSHSNLRHWGLLSYPHLSDCLCCPWWSTLSLYIYCIYSIERLVDKFILIHSWCDQLMVDTWHTGHVKRHRGQQRTIVIFISCNRRNTNVYCKGHTCRRCSKNRASSKKQLGWRRKVQERFSLLSSPAPRTVI